MVRENEGVVEVYSPNATEDFVSLQVYVEEEDDMKEERRWEIPGDCYTDEFDWKWGNKCCMGDHVFVINGGDTLIFYTESELREVEYQTPTILTYNTSTISCVAVNKDGTLIVSGDENGEVRI